MQKRLAKVTRVAANPRILCACPCCLSVPASVHKLSRFFHLSSFSGFFFFLCVFMSPKKQRKDISVSF